MFRQPLTILCVLAVSQAALPYHPGASVPDSGVCPEGSACSPPPAEDDGADEAGLLQIRRTVAAIEQPSLNGCPVEWQWLLLEGIAKATFTDMVKSFLPVSYNHTFPGNESIKLGNCSAKPAGVAQVTVRPMVDGDIGLRLTGLGCESGTCVKSGWAGCEEYAPIVIHADLEADAVHAESSFQGTVAYDDCLNASGSFEDLHTSGTVLTPSIRAVGSMNLVVNPPNISSPVLKGLQISWGNITDADCTEKGEPVEECLDYIRLMDQPEYQLELQRAIDKGLAALNSLVAGKSMLLQQPPAKA